MSAKRLIQIRTTSGGPQDEFTTNEDIQPGRLLEILSTGKVQHNDSTSQRIPIIVALANVLEGNEVGDDIDSGEVVQAVTPRSGDKVVLRLANGQTAVIGSRLVPAADGYVSVEVGDSSATDDEGCFAIATEALDLSDSSATETEDYMLVCRVI